MCACLGIRTRLVGCVVPAHQELLDAHGMSVMLKPGDALYVLSPLTYFFVPWAHQIGCFRILMVLHDTDTSILVDMVPAIGYNSLGLFWVKARNRQSN